METKELVLHYFKAWEKRDWKLMQSCLSPHFQLDGGQIQMPSAATFIAFCQNGPSWSKVKLIESLFTDTKASLLYEGVTPSGEKIRVAEFLTIEQKKISHSKLVISLA